MQGLETHGLVALVAAFLSKGLLVRPHKIAMPGEEKTVAMYTHGQVHVDGYKVIETSPRCWGPGLVGLGRQCSKTLYGFDVSLSVCLAHVLPWQKSVSTASYARRSYQSLRILALARAQPFGSFGAFGGFEDLFSTASLCSRVA